MAFFVVVFILKRSITIEQKKRLKNPRSKNKNFIVTIFFIFFRSRDAIFQLWSQTFDFLKVFWDFQKWTFINVQNWLSEKGFGVKNRKFARWELSWTHIFPSQKDTFIEGLKETLMHLPAQIFLVNSRGFRYATDDLTKVAFHFIVIYRPKGLDMNFQVLSVFSAIVFRTTRIRLFPVIHT